MREFYVQSSNKRTQWVDKINEVSSMLVNFSVYGLLLKQGEHNKSSWRERWCLCSGRSFDYFESATDNQSKGSLGTLKYSAENERFFIVFILVFINCRFGEC